MKYGHASTHALIAAIAMIGSSIGLVGTAQAAKSALCVTCSGGAPTLSGSGGLRHAEVVPIFWGAWPNTQVPNSGQLIGSIQWLLNGPYYAALNQYNNIGLARMAPTAPILNTAIPANYSPANIQTAINGEIAAGVVPKPSAGADIVYAVILPPNTLSSQYGNAPGFNGGLTYTDGTKYSYFFVSGTSNALTGYASYMHIFSHELAESMSQGVTVSGCGAKNNQIGDLCQCLTENELGGQLTVGAYWSRTDNSCVIPESWSGIWQYSGTPGNWTLIGGGAREIAAGTFGVVATDTNDNPALYTNSTLSWTPIGTPGAMYAVGTNGIFGLAADASTVFFWNGSWTAVGGAATSVIAGGSFLATDTGGNPWLYTPSANSWAKIGGPGDEFVATASFVLGLSPDHQQVNLWSGSGTRWSQAAGSASHIFGASSSNVLGGISLDTTRGVSVWTGTSPGSFRSQNGQGSDFAITGSSSGQQLYGLPTTRSGVIQSTNLGATNPPWTTVGGAAGRLIGGDHYLYATNGINY